MTNLAYDITDEQETARPDVAAMQALRPIPRISIQAFCETEGVAQPIERAGDDRRMAKTHLKVHMGGVAAAIEGLAEDPRPDASFPYGPAYRRLRVGRYRVLYRIEDKEVSVIVLNLARSAP